MDNSDPLSVKNVDIFLTRNTLVYAIYYWFYYRKKVVKRGKGETKKVVIHIFIVQTMEYSKL